MIDHFFSHPQSQSWIRWLIITAVFLLSALIAVNVRGLSIYMMVAILGLLGILFLLRFPQLGLFALLIVAMIVPFQLGTGTNVSLNAAFLFCPLLIGLWLFRDFLLKKNPTTYRSRTFIPLLGLSITTLLSFISAQLPWVPFAGTASIPAQLGGLMIFLFSAGIFILTAHQVTEIKWLKWLVWLFLFFAGVYLLRGLIPDLAIIPIRLTPGATGSVFWIWLVSLSFSQAFFNRKLDIRIRLILGIMAAAALYIGYFRALGWASGWLPPVIAFLAILAARKPAVFLPILIIFLGFIYFNLDTIIENQIFGDQEYSLLTRLEAYSIVLELSKANPVLGLGPANYRFYTPLIPILGYYINFNSHNQYIDLIAQTGFLGLGFFLWFFAEVSLIAWNIKDRVSRGGFRYAFAFGAIGGIAGMLASGMLGDWVLPFVYNIGIPGFRASIFGWVFLGGLVAIERLLGVEKNAPQENS